VSNDLWSRAADAVQAVPQVLRQRLGHAFAMRSSVTSSFRPKRSARVPQSIGVLGFG